MDDGRISLGNGFSYNFFQWAPDRDLNPQYEGIPDIEKAGIILYKQGKSIGSCWFDLPDVRHIPNNQGPFWQLVNLEPLHLNPSIQTYKYDDKKKQLVPDYHGWIQDGVWRDA